MSPFFITTIAVGVIVLFLVWYINTNLDRIKQKKEKKIAGLKNYIARLQRFYDPIPTNYLSREVKLLLLNELIDQLQELLKLDSDNEQLKANLNKRVKQKQDALESNAKPTATNVTSADDSAEIRRRLVEIQKFIGLAKKNKKISNDAAKHELDTLKILFVETGTSLMINSAKKAKKDNKPRLALHYYERALGEYKKANMPHFSKRVAELQALIKTMKAEAGSGSNDEAGTELSKAMDSLMADEDAEKKSKF